MGCCGGASELLRASGGVWSSLAAWGEPFACLAVGGRRSRNVVHSDMRPVPSLAGPIFRTAPKVRHERHGWWALAPETALSIEIAPLRCRHSELPHVARCLVTAVSMYAEC